MKITEICGFGSILTRPIHAVNSYRSILTGQFLPVHSYRSILTGPFLPKSIYTLTIHTLTILPQDNSSLGQFFLRTILTQDNFYLGQFLPRTNRDPLLLFSKRCDISNSGARYTYEKRRGKRKEKRREEKSVIIAPEIWVHKKVHSGSTFVFQIPWLQRLRRLGLLQRFFFKFLIFSKTIYVVIKEHYYVEIYFWLIT